MGEITPYNRIENFLAKGSGADVAPYNRLERILAGEDLEPTNRLEYFAKEAAGGGGNPNRVQTITGTAENPWGDVDAQELAVAMKEGNASATMKFTSPGGAYEQTLYTTGLNGYIALEGCSINGVEALGYQAVWDSDTGALTRLFQFDSTNTPQITDLGAYASLITTTLTIIWHPLPD